MASIRYGRIPEELTPALPTIVRIGKRIDGKSAEAPRPAMLSRLGWIVPKAFASLVDSLEPGIHANWPLQVETSTGNYIAEQFFLVEPGPRIDSIIPERSNVTMEPARKADDGKGGD